MSSQKLARSIFHNLVEGLGIDCAVVCAGARNAPLVRALEEIGLESFHFYHENSAGFYALGLAKKGKRPVVLCTSGTAVAQLLAACIEAFYDERFIVFLTADRPKEYRYTGAPQTIDQSKIFDSFVYRSLDLSRLEEIEGAEFKSDLPIHINACFDEPLWWDEEPVDDSLTNTCNWKYIQASPAKVEAPKLDRETTLVILSRLEKNECDLVFSYFEEKNVKLYLEASSQLNASKLSKKNILINTEEELVKRYQENEFTKILHIGGVPTLKLWRLLSCDNNIDVYSFGRGSYSGLVGTKRTRINDWNNFFSELSFSGEVLNQSLDSSYEKELSNYPQSEPFIFEEIKKRLAKSDYVYVGNSMPIRYYDKNSYPNIDHFDANRGANGIDGQISSFFGGIPAKAKRAVCILGDLTFMYDLQGLWASKYQGLENICFIVINNSGGRIFDRVFPRNPFANPHEYSFENIAKFYSYSYQKALPESLPATGKWIIELKTDNEQTSAFHNKWTAKWK